MYERGRFRQLAMTCSEHKSLTGGYVDRFMRLNTNEPHHCIDNVLCRIIVRLRQRCKLVALTKMLSNDRIHISSDNKVWERRGQHTIAIKLSVGARPQEVRNKSRKRRASSKQ
jgi:hypothetical protein